MVRRQAMTRPRTPAATRRVMQGPHAADVLGRHRRPRLVARRLERTLGTPASARLTILGREAETLQTLVMEMPMTIVMPQVTEACP